ncbi:MAG TPA: hypothetical protein VND64_00035, partial [Pirellulales bacterium]|nr:hypothetical protein [Pirellulales bacterium]
MLQFGPLVLVGQHGPKAIGLHIGDEHRLGLAVTNPDTLIVGLVTRALLHWQSLVELIEPFLALPRTFGDRRGVGKLVLNRILLVSRFSTPAPFPPPGASSVRTGDGWLQ